MSLILELLYLFFHFILVNYGIIAKTRVLMAFFSTSET